MSDEQKKEKDKKVILVFLFLFILILFLIQISPDLTSPREPQNLECVNYKNLCIATTDVKYDYTAVKTRTAGYPAYNKEWNNGWESAQKACREWGGRLPFMEDFAIIVDAHNNNVINLKDYGSYLSATQINPYKIWAYSHHNNYASKGYNPKSIYDAAIAIEKSADWVITGNYNTGTAYTWNARCVK